MVVFWHSPMRISRHHRRKPTVADKVRVKINEFIRAPELRLIDSENKHIGIMSLDDALKLAAEQEKDLVEINPATNPPVAKIMEYGQYKYQQEKQERLRRVKQKEVLLKGIRLSARIGVGDLEMRRNQAIGFMSKGNNVKIEIILRGREKGHTDIARTVIKDFITAIEASGEIRIEQPIAQQGPRITAIIAPVAIKVEEEKPIHQLDESAQ